MHDLEYYEQKVNNRFGTSAAPPIEASMLPETARPHALPWRRIPAADITWFDDGSDDARAVAGALRQEDAVLMPIHPLETDRWPDESFVESGLVSVSASYRTMFFKPEKGGILDSAAGSPETLMMKLHLERPLPGIDGDRRISPQIAQKCVSLSTFLQETMASDPLGADCEIVPEFLALSGAGTGVIFRRLPAAPVLPLFALFSPDEQLAGGESHIDAALRRLYGDDSMRAADAIGDELARPLLRPLFAGFRHGFSIEMHAQNVLVRPGATALIERVFLRDLEGVVLSNAYRIARGLEPVFTDLDNPALTGNQVPMSRWFNRNVDHDLGRVFTASLDALERSGYFGQRERARAIRSIRAATRETVREAGLEPLNRPGRWLPVSRSPYGNGLGKGHYYRVRYR
jgi:hypothetical protein